MTNRTFCIDSNVLIYAVSFGNHEPHVDIEHLWLWDLGTEFSIILTCNVSLLNFNVKFEFNVK